MGNIKAVETVYKGYRFRSRLEARWAIFFDTLGLKWEYEVDGYDLGKLGWYLPDFRVYGLLDSPIWFEIKPIRPTNIELAKLGALGDIVQQKYAFLVGTPYAHPNSYGGFEYSDYAILFNDMSEGLDGITYDGYAIFVQCRRCENIGFEDAHFHCDTGYPYTTYGLSGICCSENCGYAASTKLVNAYNKAMSARFEHGEC